MVPNYAQSLFKCPVEPFASHTLHCFHVRFSISLLLYCLMKQGNVYLKAKRG